MVLNRQNKVRVELAPLETFLKKVRTVARIANREVTVCLVSDAEMARMNRAYRRKRGPTDVLSFPATATKCGTEREPQGFLGDIAIAPETARRYQRADIPRRCARVSGCRSSATSSWEAAA